MKKEMIKNKNNNLPESELCFALVTLLLNFTVVCAAVAVLWYMFSIVSQNLPMMLVQHEIR